MSEGFVLQALKGGWIDQTHDNPDENCIIVGKLFRLRYRIFKLSKFKLWRNCKLPFHSKTEN